METTGGATVTSYNASNVPLTVTGAANSPSGKAPVLPTSATFVNGVATVPVTLYSATSQTLTFSLGNGQTAQAAVTPVAASVVNITSTTAASSQNADTVNNPGVTYTFDLTDAYGNPVSVSGQTVNFTLNTGSSDQGTYTMSSASGQTGTNGAVTVTVSSTSPKAGDTFYVTGTTTIAGTPTSATGGTTTVTAGTAVAISYVSPGTSNVPYDITVAQAESGMNFVVHVTDAYGNPVANQVVTITGAGGNGNWSYQLSSPLTDASGNFTVTASDANAQIYDGWQMTFGITGSSANTAVLIVK